MPEPDRFEQTAFDGGLGTTLGSRASVRTNFRYSRGQGRNVGPITYGSRDSGGVYDTKDLTWTVAVPHDRDAVLRHGHVQLLQLQQLSVDSFANPPYLTFAILTGTPNALFPNGTRLVRLIDAAEFNALVAAGALPAPGQFLASDTTSDFTGPPSLKRSSATAPAVRYQGDVAFAGSQRLSVGYEWDGSVRPIRSSAPGSAEQRGLHSAAVRLRQPVVRDLRRACDSKEGYDTFFSPKLSAGGFLLPFTSGGVSSVKVFGNIGRGIKSPTFSERFGGSFADPVP